MRGECIGKRSATRPVATAGSHHACAGQAEYFEWSDSLVICVGIAGVVAVLVSVLAMARGLVDTLARVGEADRVIVFRKGALAESLSSLSREAVFTVETAPGIDLDGELPAVSPEVVRSINLPLAEGPGNGGILVGSSATKQQSSILDSD